MTTAKSGWGAQFWLDNAVPTAVELVEVVSFTLPNGQVEMLDATHLKSPNRHREFIAGPIDDGDLQVVINYVPGGVTDALIVAAKADGVVRDFLAVIPRTTANWEIDGQGIVMGWDRGEIVMDGVMRGTLTLKVSGSQTEAAAS